MTNYFNGSSVNVPKTVSDSVIVSVTTPLPLQAGHILVVLVLNNGSGITPLPEHEGQTIGLCVIFAISLIYLLVMVLAPVLYLVLLVVPDSQAIRYNSHHAHNLRHRNT
jgi:hypothetical protein